MKFLKKSNNGFNHQEDNFPKQSGSTLIPQYPSVYQKLISAVGDMRQPWIEKGDAVGITPFDAKALFAIVMMKR